MIINRLDKKNEGKLLVRDLIEVIFAGDTSVTGDFSSIMDTNIQRQIDIKSTLLDCNIRVQGQGTPALLWLISVMIIAARCDTSKVLS